MTQPLAKTAQLSFPGWLLPWFRQLYFYDKIVIVTAAAGFIAAVISFIKKFRAAQFLQYLFIITIGLQLLLWLFVAPDPRFAYGCLLCFIVFCPSIVTYFLNEIQLKKIHRFLIIAMTGITMFYAAQKMITTPDNRNWFVPKPLPIPQHSEIIIDKTTYTIPQPFIPGGDTCCYGLKLPCLYKLSPRLKLRGAAIQQGFYLKN